MGKTTRGAPGCVARVYAMQMQGVASCDCGASSQLADKRLQHESVYSSLLATVSFCLTDYDHVLLDMNGTFLFDFDKFGPEQDFGSTYVSLGYRGLTPAEAQAHVRRAYDYLAVRYIDETYYDSFPSVTRALRASGGEQLTDQTIEELVDTFAVHEFGVLPQGHKEALTRLAQIRPVSVLSNLWAPKQRWLAAFEAWGIADLFDALHFSSDGASMKPHPTFFDQALRAIWAKNPTARVVHVGDSYRCDVAGALGAGIDAVWLSEQREVGSREQGLVARFPDFISFVEALD